MLDFFLYLSFFGKLKCSFLVSFFFFNLTSCMGRRGNVRDSKTVLAPFFFESNVRSTMAFVVRSKGEMEAGGF